MLGECKLCKIESNLKVSHMIPQFFTNWIKETSATSFLRLSNNPSKRAQDSTKEHWLCGSCENIFSQWESEFAKKVFYPCINEKKRNINYGSWMSKFCASLSWRTLTYIRSTNRDTPESDRSIVLLDNAEKHLANYLLGRVDNLYQYEQHLYPVESIESYNYSGMPTNINRYYLRATAMDIIESSSDVFVYTKLPSFILLGCIKIEQIKKMRVSRIVLKNGKISPGQYVLPSGFFNYIVGKSWEAIDLLEQIPENQRKNIEECMMKNPEKTANSGTIKALLDDHKQFGDDVFKR